MRYLSLVAVCVGLAAAGWQWAMPDHGGNLRPSPGPVIEGLLRDAISRDARLCIAAGSFPLTINDGHSEKSCDRCEDLMDAGLITRAGGDSGSIATRFSLTEAGRRVYREAGDPRLPMGMKESAFCFGRPVLHRIDQTLAPMQTGIHRMVGLKFTVQVLEPDPLLLEDTGAVLGLPAPMSRDPVLLAPQIVTAIVSPDGQQAYLDPDIRYGEFMRP